MSGRSDFTATTNGDTASANGVNNANNDDENDGADNPNGTPGRTWSIFAEDPKSALTDEPDDPINRYVREQLARVKANDAAEMAEELASQNDGANGR